MKKQISIRLTKNKWIPEIISIVGKETDKGPISHEVIYQWIWKCKQGIKAEDRQLKDLYTTLKNGKRRRKRGSRNDSRGIIPNRGLSKIVPPLLIAEADLETWKLTL
ncbi:hypothetical protein GCM10027036_20910 [Flavihumibacter cheonanensis]|nr:hypothetical protein [Flavihumibacter cheonanensis]MCG7754223.1 hypothetical protein [Flavihumibacter cheonanensis]